MILIKELDDVLKLQGRLFFYTLIELRTQTIFFI